MLSFSCKVFLFIYFIISILLFSDDLFNIQFFQENRPFDHYFGTLKGVRGFNDRVTVPLSSGLNAFYQPVSGITDEYMLPFRAEVQLNF